MIRIPRRTPTIETEFGVEIFVGGGAAFKGGSVWVERAVKLIFKETRRTPVFLHSGFRHFFADEVYSLDLAGMINREPSPFHNGFFGYSLRVLPPFG